MTVVETSKIKERECHLKIRYNTAKGIVMILQVGVNPETIGNGLNECLRNLHERKAYFSKASLNRFGDVLLSLSDTRVEGIHHYLNALSVELENMGLVTGFLRSNEKVQ